LILWSNYFFLFFWKESRISRKSGKNQVGILIVAAALRATATAELSYRFSALYWRYIRHDKR
jgi:hypothetical protein